MNVRRGSWLVDQMDKKLIENEIFYCEPLLTNEENLRLIQKFHVAAETGLGLEMYLKKFAVSDEFRYGSFKKEVEFISIGNRFTSGC